MVSKWSLPNNGWKMLTWRTVKIKYYFYVMHINTLAFRKKKKNEHLWLRLNTELPSVVTCVLSLFSGFNIFFPLCFLKSHTGVKNPKLKTLLHFWGNQTKKEQHRVATLKVLFARSSNKIESLTLCPNNIYHCQSF